MYVHDIAHVCHEANRALQIINNDPVSVEWNALDQETKNSAADGVVNAMNGATPRESHENWLKFKTEHGWAYGPIKDEATKTHPCMVPYDDLPIEQCVKDTLFVAIVNALGNTHTR